MTSPTSTAPEVGVDLDNDDDVDAALRDAVYAALRAHKADGDPVVAWQDGQLVHIAARDIVLPEDNA